MMNRIADVETMFVELIHVSGSLVCLCVNNTPVNDLCQEFFCFF